MEIVGLLGQWTVTRPGLVRKPLNSCGETGIPWNRRNHQKGCGYYPRRLEGSDWLESRVLETGFLGTQLRSEAGTQLRGEAVRSEAPGHRRGYGTEVRVLSFGFL